MRTLADRLREQAKAAADDRDLTSRTDRRREQRTRELRLKALANRLVSLKPQQIERLALGEELLDAIAMCQAIASPKAKNRQVGVVRQHLRELGPAVDAIERRLSSQ